MLLSIFIIVLMTKGIFFNFLKTPLGLIFTASVIILVSSSIWSHNFIATIWVNNVWLRSILGLIYIPFLLAFILLLWKNLPVAPYFLLFLFFTVWVTDAAAYIGGSIFGKYHFVPSLSPSKSLEGTLIGTFMGGFLVALIAYITFLSPFLSLLQTLILSLAGSVATQVGDLVESGYKRLAAKKDTDNWLPGYGGILDTFDGMCLAAPVIFYLLWIFGKI
jgi:phosphatidate cytidylyltransferase